MLQPGLREPRCSPLSSALHPAALAPADNGLFMCREDLSWKELQPHLVPQGPGSASASPSRGDADGEPDQRDAEGEGPAGVRDKNCHSACGPRLAVLLCGQSFLLCACFLRGPGLCHPQQSSQIQMLLCLNTSLTCGGSSCGSCLGQHSLAKGPFSCACP